MNENKIVIGKQVWMTFNLSVDKFRNGDLIPEAKTAEEWAKAGRDQMPAWCYYGNNAAILGEAAGKLYNWYAVNDPRGLAPEGWHVPSKAEWIDLFNFIGKLDQYGFWHTDGKMKIGDWGEYDKPTNESGFSAYPTGMRNGTPWKGDKDYYDEHTKFSHYSNYGVGEYWSIWWSSSRDEVSSEIQCFELSDGGLGAVRKYNRGEEDGIAVRCIQD